jgi:hypothetical protein
LRAICEMTGIDPDSALRITAELLSIGLVEAMPAAPPKPARPTAPAPRQRTVPASDADSSPTGTEPPDEHADEPEKKPARVGRSLLNAILRRVSEL